LDKEDVMVIARAKGASGRDILLLGLSAENVRRLQGGEPIRVTQETHGPGIPEGWVIGLVFGETEEDIEISLRKEGLITEGTFIYRTPRRP
jgi:hypothetical protein